MIKKSNVFCKSLQKLDEITWWNYLDITGNLSIAFTIENQLNIFIWNLKYISFLSDFKAGICPIADLNYRLSCPPSDGFASCLLDSECSGTKKCCSDGCTLVCTNVEKPKQPKVPGN